MPHIIPEMPSVTIERFGRDSLNWLVAFGDFWRFVGHVFAWLRAGLSRKTLRLMPPLMYEIGVKSMPVVAITGAFIGMVLAVEAYNQFKSIGQENRLGAIINVSVVKQIGPVLAAVMLAGRVGGALTAELGTMNVTEQIDALRVMGADPIRYLVVPRVLALALMLPCLTVIVDIVGMIGGWAIGVTGLGINSHLYIAKSIDALVLKDIYTGLLKSIIFSILIALVSCHQGLSVSGGADAVGKATTQAVVISIVLIIVVDCLATAVIYYALPT